MVKEKRRERERLKARAGRKHGHIGGIRKHQASRTANLETDQEEREER